MAWAAGPSVGQLLGGVCPRCGPTHPFLPGPPEDRVEVTSPEAAAELVGATLVGWDRERCVALLLDTKHRLIDLVTVSIGSVDHTFMAPREVFRDALLANASAVVLAHNHPSGDPEPSRDDRDVTVRLVRAGRLLGVEVLDHLVIGAARWVSLARRGVIQGA